MGDSALWHALDGDYTRAIGNPNNVGFLKFKTIQKGEKK
jgi:hypothetical protein